MGKGGQKWAGLTDQAGMGDMASGWVWVCVQVQRGVGKFGQTWTRVGKDGQVCIGKTDRAGMGGMECGWVWVCLKV